MLVHSMNAKMRTLLFEVLYCHNSCKLLRIENTAMYFQIVYHCFDVIIVNWQTM